jgi:hypothetical protein
VLWNWRRILLLGLSLTLAAGNQFSLALLGLLSLPLMFWVAPVRRRAVIAIWSAAVAIAVVFLSGAYFLRLPLLWQSMRHARWIDFEPAALRMSVSYLGVLQRVMLSSPPLLFAVPVAVIVYAGWKRCRYFGNTLPLLIAGLLIILFVAAPSFPGQGLSLTLVVFLFVFVSGVSADLLEGRQRLIVAAGLLGLLSASAVWNLLQLWRASSQ